MLAVNADVTTHVLCSVSASSAETAVETRWRAVSDSGTDMVYTWLFNNQSTRSAGNYVSLAMSTIIQYC